MRTLLACLLLTTAALAQVATQPATQPADVYAAAGAARRAAGVESWMFIHPTWINWRPENWASRAAHELFDGYLLMMLDREGVRPVDAVRAKLRLCEADCKLRVIPGLRVAAQASYAEWTDPSSWKRDYDFYLQIREEFGQTPLALDAEPYAVTGKRYPVADDVYAMRAAMGEWIGTARDTELWITPGGVHYWNAWTLASIRARRGPVYMLDQATFGRPDNVEQIIRERQAYMEPLGMTYVPGFYLRHAIDPALYAMLERLSVKRCWFFAQAVPDDYSRFSRPDWEHVND